MSEQPAAPPKRSYGCSFGCGNPYDYILVSVADGSIEFLCLACYVRLARDMIVAVVDTGDPKVIEALAYASSLDLDPTPGPDGRPRGHNAPVTAEDDALFEAYDSRVTAEELPDEFK